jgi:hypothetical protein
MERLSQRQVFFLKTLYILLTNPDSFSRQFLRRRETSIISAMEYLAIFTQLTSEVIGGSCWMTAARFRGALEWAAFL